MKTTLEEIADALEKGKCKRVIELVKMAKDEGYSVTEIAEKGFLIGMEHVSYRFQHENLEVPEILSITRALNGGMNLLDEYMENYVTHYIGKVVLGTSKKDFHEMGKNLIKMMLESRGMKVIDLGVDVSAHRFYEMAVEQKADVICCSGSLDSSVRDMKKMIEIFEDHGVREDYYIMVGGKALDSRKAEEIGADCFTDDGISCMEMAEKFCKTKYKKKRK